MAGGEHMADVAKRVRVTGRVQGVWFRAWTQERAEALGLRGWVRNEPDGSVAALIAGPEAAVAQMLVELHEGPRAAAVSRVEAEPAEPPAAAGFAVLR
jgi:acylphosphatase